jgi:hypothetical protein
MAGGNHVTVDPPANNTLSYIVLGTASGGAAVVIYYTLRKKKNMRN